MNRDSNIEAGQPTKGSFRDRLEKQSASTYRDAVREVKEFRQAHGDKDGVCK